MTLQMSCVSDITLRHSHLRRYVRRFCVSITLNIKCCYYMSAIRLRGLSCSCCSVKQRYSAARMRRSSMTTIILCALIALANAVDIHVCSSEYTRQLDFGEWMLMVAYDSVAYGSLLHIVAYEVLMFHVLNIIKHEKKRRRFCPSNSEKKWKYSENENIRNQVLHFHVPEIIQSRKMKRPTDR